MVTSAVMYAAALDYVQSFGDNGISCVVCVKK